METDLSTSHGLLTTQLLLRLGISMKEIQEWLAYPDFSTTANIYSHVDITSKQEMGDKISKAIGI